MNQPLIRVHRYGFIQYNNFTQSENCIRGFYHLGYEAKFARVTSPSYRMPIKN